MSFNMMEFDGQNEGGNASGKVKNIYARGADDGLWLGLCLTLAFVLMALSLDFPLLNLGGDCVVAWRSISDVLFFEADSCGGLWIDDVLSAMDAGDNNVCLCKCDSRFGEFRLSALD